MRLAAIFVLFLGLGIACGDPEDSQGPAQSPCEDDVCPDSEDEADACEADCNEGDGLAGTYRFVLLTDLSDPVAGPYPGADIDAVELIKPDRTHFATTVHDVQISMEGNHAADSTQMVGPPDADCDLESGAFAALGGSATGGYAIFSFGTSTEPVFVENGDTIRVYELGQSLCDEFDDDPYQVSIGVGETIVSFAETGVRLADGPAGGTDTPVFGLP
jgi:hypothetical protein